MKQEEIEAIYATSPAFVDFVQNGKLSLEYFKQLRMFFLAMANAKDADNDDKWLFNSYSFYLCYCSWICCIWMFCECFLPLGRFLEFVTGFTEWN